MKQKVIQIGSSAGVTIPKAALGELGLADVELVPTFADALRTNPMSFIVPKTFVRDFKGSVIYVGARDGEVLRDIWVWDLDRQSRVRRLVRAGTRGPEPTQDATERLVAQEVDPFAREVEAHVLRGRLREPAAERDRERCRATNESF